MTKRKTITDYASYYTDQDKLRTHLRSKARKVACEWGKWLGNSQMFPSDEFLSAIANLGTFILGDEKFDYLLTKYNK